MTSFIENKKSNINGNGLFTLKDFNRGEILYSFKKGKTVKLEEIKNLSEIEKIHLDKIGGNKFEIIERPGCYINHSCEPNSEEKNRVGYALRKIKKGEEITIDYNVVSYIEKPFKCHCGSKKCRKFVEGRK